MRSQKLLEPSRSMNFYSLPSSSFQQAQLWVHPMVETVSFSSILLAFITSKIYLYHSISNSSNYLLQMSSKPSVRVTWLGIRGQSCTQEFYLPLSIYLCPSPLCLINSKNIFFFFLNSKNIYFQFQATIFNNDECYYDETFKP